MSVLFQKTEIAGMTLANRFARSATWEGMAEENGACTPRLVALMAELAAGGVGLIITSHAYVRKDGQASLRQLGIQGDDLIPGLSEMTRAVHERGGRIVAQLAHGGFNADPKLAGQTPLAPSALEGFGDPPRREMSEKDVPEVAEAFGQAARRAVEAGFDGVQIHAAHGYLLCQFLSPFFNRRRDGYGGPVENRVKPLLEVLRRVREAVGPARPVLIKMNGEDFLEGGLTLDDSVQAGAILAEAGIDAIEVSGGMRLAGPELMPSRMGILSPQKEAYFRVQARAFKERAGVPVMLVGGIRSLDVAEQVVTGGVADYVSMSRPFIREPGLVKRWQEGDRRPALCLSDNQCFGPAAAGEGMYCVVARKEREAR
jgi:2,4-dienoyl-CoA reductase-like NADH-dependent reductase (Old Yellow Enzyme family)